MDTLVRRYAIRYLGKLFVQLTLSTVLFFVAAGTWRVPIGIIYFSVYLVLSLFGGVFLLYRDPETLSSRDRIASDTKGWDRVLLLLYVPLAYFGIYIAAGIPHRLAGVYPPQASFWIGIGATVLSSFLIVWSVHVNRHFESSVRIQRDRHHAVCSTGPYAIVRHPGYTGIILWAIAMLLMFGWYAGSVSAAIIALVFIRTRLEDATLHRELPGYAVYAKQVPCRLILFLW